MELRDVVHCGVGGPPLEEGLLGLGVAAVLRLEVFVVPEARDRHARLSLVHARRRGPHDVFRSPVSTHLPVDRRVFLLDDAFVLFPSLDDGLRSDSAMVDDDSCECALVHVLDVFFEPVVDGGLLLSRLESLRLRGG